MATHCESRMSDELPSSSTSHLPQKRARYVRDPRGRDESLEIEEEMLYMNKVINWQNQQMAKAVFDNTVNSVIESMGFPLPDIETIMDNYGGSNGNFEDEAVEMAIRSHGLQKPCSCPDLQPLPTVPFHRRPQFTDSVNLPGSSSASFDSSCGKEERAEFEHDFLSEAVAVAIQKKGLGAFPQPNSR